MGKTRRGKDDDGLISPSSSIDRISELSEPILHHILSFLPQNQAVQTSVLSKPWRHLWCTRPNIELGQDLSEVSTETFMAIFDHTLQRYHHQNLSINRLVMDMWWVDLDLISLLEKWIPIVLMDFRVETFHLIYPDPSGCFHRHFPSARVIFQAEFLKELCLSGFKINSTDVCLKHLQTLSLCNVYIEDEALEKILASCPLIQRVILDQCNGLTTVKVNNLKHLCCLDSCQNIEIRAPSALETIKISSCPNLYLHSTNNHHFPRLKSLYLCEVHLSKDFSSAIFSCNYLCLEDLELISCSGFKDVKILSCSFKHLTIADTKNQVETIIIDAPDLLYFEFSCGSSVSFPSVSFAATASKSNIYVPFQLKCSKDVDMFLKLNEVLKALRQSRITLSLYFVSIRNQHIEDVNYVGCCEPVAVENLNLIGFASFDCFAALFNYLFRIFRPRYIYRRMYPILESMQYLRIDKLAEFVLKTNLKDGEFNLWQRELKELRLELFDHGSKKWCLVQGSRFPVIEEKHDIRLVFDWSDSVLLA